MDFKVSRETLRQLKHLSRLWGEDTDSILSRCVEWTFDTHPYRNGLMHKDKAVANDFEDVIQVAEYLERRTDMAQRFVDKLERDFEKWVVTRRGRKPYSPGAMQLDIDAMRYAVASLRKIVNADDSIAHFLEV